MVGKTSNNARAPLSTLDPHPPAHLSGVVAPNSRARRRQTRPLFDRTSAENSITRRRFDVRCGLPSAFSGPGLRGLGGAEVRVSPEPPARRAGPQPRASRLQPPPGSRGAWGARRASER